MERRREGKRKKTREKRTRQHNTTQHNTKVIVLFSFCFVLCCLILRFVVLCCVGGCGELCCPIVCCLLLDPLREITSHNLVLSCRRCCLVLSSVVILSYLAFLRCLPCFFACLADCLDITKLSIGQLFMESIPVLVCTPQDNRH
jgi:hypothetical protein